MPRTTVIFRVRGNTEAELWEQANATLDDFFEDRDDPQVKLEARPLVFSEDGLRPVSWEGEVEARS